MTDQDPRTGAGDGSRRRGAPRLLEREVVSRPCRAPPYVHRRRHHEDQPRQDEQFDPLDVPPEGLLRLGRHDEHLADAGNQADDEERLRVEGLVPDGETDGVEQLGHDEQHKAVVQGGENDRLLAVRPLDRPDDVMDDPDGQEPREQYEERRDDEVDAVLDELQEALYPAALDLRESGSHSQHARAGCENAGHRHAGRSCCAFVLR